MNCIFLKHNSHHLKSFCSGIMNSRTLSIFSHLKPEPELYGLVRALGTDIEISPIDEKLHVDVHGFVKTSLHTGQSMHSWRS